MDVDRQILEKLSELDKVVENVQDIDEAEYTDRMHIEPKYDTSDDVLRAFVDDLRYDEETAEQVYKDLLATNYSSDEIKEVFIEHTDIEKRELSPINRRQFLMLAGGAAAGSYTADSRINQYKLKNADQAQFEAPAGSYHEPAVENILEGGQMDVHIFNIYLGMENKPNYNKERISKVVEENLDELEDVNPAISFHDVNITPETIYDKLPVSKSFAESAFKNFENNLNNSGVMDTNPSFIEGYVDDLIDYDEHNITEESVKVGLADFRDSNFAGVSKSNEFTGEKDWAFLSRLSENQLIDSLTHEVAHKLGLPHTKYPDLKRKGFFPDTMSYSTGKISIPNRIHSLIDNSAFGNQSHYNWQKVKDGLQE